PTRRTILRMLNERDMTAGEIAALFFIGCAAAPVKPARLVFERSGGIAGFDDRLEIDLITGATLLKQGTEVTTTTLNAEQLASLQRHIADLNLENLSVSPPYQCCDLLLYRIQIDATTIETTDADLPTLLQPFVATLNNLIAEIDKSDTSYNH
uniref:protealysin inhibitor emfourin n=1 Tax=uncultured Chloroflexus sp. TaxID=214040 RepID=UPI0026326596